MSTLSGRHRYQRMVVSLAAGFAAVLLLAACGGNGTTTTEGEEDEELREINVMLDFRWSGQHVPLFAAEHMGAFADEGLSVNFLPPASPGDTVRFVAAGSVPFGFTFTTDLLIAAPEVTDVVSIASTIRRNPHGVGALEGFDLEGPESLRGARVGATSAPVSQAMLDAFLTAGDMTREDIEVVTLGFGPAQALIEGQTDVNVGVDYGDLGAATRMAGHTTTFLYFRDFGVPDYPFASLISTRSYLENNGDVARAFLRAYSRGVDAALEDPAPALQLAGERIEALDLDFLELSWELVSEHMVDATTESEGHGWHDFESLQAMSDFLAEQGLSTEAVDAQQLATDDYLE